MVVKLEFFVFFEGEEFGGENYFRVGFRIDFLGVFFLGV